MMVTGKKDNPVRMRKPRTRCRRTASSTISRIPAASLSVAALTLLHGIAAHADPSAGEQQGAPPGAPPIFPAVPATSPVPKSSPTPTPTPTPKPGEKDKNGQPVPPGQVGKDGKPTGKEREEDSQYVPFADKPLAERLLGKWGKGLTVTGSFRTMVQANSVSGSAPGSQLFTEQNATNNLDYRSAGPFQNSMDVTLSGKVFNAFDVNARLSNSRFGNQFNQVFRFQYQSKDKKTSFDVGNIPATLQGNELVSFARNLQGLMFGRDFADGRITMTGLASFTRGITRRGTFRGQGTAGPYFMNASLIIEGSERVRLNGQDLTRDTDYRIDYYMGTLTFLNGRIINPEDTVEFTYEAQNFNTQPGLLTGMRWNFNDPIKGNSYGVTYLQQSPTGQRTSNGDVVERFPVFADPNYRYQLSNLIDPSRPVVIKWLNRELVEGLDYYLNKELRFFRLLNTGLPPDTSLTGIASLSVTYRPVRQNSLVGNRNILGVDTLMKVGGNGTVGIQFGQSDSPSADQTGVAMKVTTNWASAGKGDKNNWKFGLTYNDVDANFSTIDSTAGAFLQPQRGFRADLAFDPNKYMSITTSLNQGQVGNRSYSTTGTGGTTGAEDLIWATNQGMALGIGLNYPNWPTISLKHQQTTQIAPQTTTGAESRSLFANTGLDIGYNIGAKLQLSAGIGRTTSQGRSVFSTAYNNNVLGNGSTTGSSIIDQIQDPTGSRSVTDSTSDYTRFGARYIPFEHLSINGNIGFSRAVSGSSTGDSSTSSGNTARTMGLGITARPLPNMNVTFNYMEGNNGRSTSGFYDPNDPGGNSIIPTNTDGQSTKSTDFSVQYMPIGSVTLNFVTRRDLSLIPGYDNTSSTANTYGFSFRPKEWLDLSLNVTDQKLQYVGGQGDSKNNTMFFQATVGPIGRATFSAGVSRTRFDSATYYNNNSGGGTGTPGYGLGGGTNTGFGNRLNGTGILQAGINTTYAFQMEYDISRKRMIVFSWQTLDQATPGIQNSDGTGTDTTGQYRSQTNFRQGIGTIGFSYPLDRITSFNINYNLTNLIDRDNNRYSYRANTFTAGLGASF
jgi:hypothetical protein